MPAPSEAASARARDRLGRGAWPLVTVAVLVYNQAAYVEQCLESVLAADYPALELIIFDDASQDGSADRVQAWISAHPSCGVPMTLRRGEVNQGVSKNLNRAIAAASGEYVLPLAADDELLPDGIKARVEHLERHPERLAVFADCRVIDAAGRMVWPSGIEGLYRHKHMRKRELGDPDYLAAALVHCWAVPGPVILLRKRVCEIAGGYCEDLLVEDWDMYLRLAASGALGFEDRIVSSYRMHGANVSRVRRRRVLEDLHRTAARNAHLYDGAAGRILRLKGSLVRARNWPQMLWWLACAGAGAAAWAAGLEFRVRSHFRARGQRRRQFRERVAPHSPFPPGAAPGPRE